MASAGFGVLAVYWGMVARLTFWDYGWDAITYLSSLSMIIAGYLWFLYQGREVLYSSVPDRSIPARRETLYKARGLDIECWLDLVTEGRSLRREIRRISENYEHHEQSSGEGEDEDADADTDDERERTGSERDDDRDGGKR
ncbi:hypothetical protein B0H17DRAFT_1128742 [Mycena rosella]|uniref:Calcium uniporter protein, mitochondrial n=1 Tax=Mycena rosella TaxID=1033263 RepID=A0AAD7DX32_MYCRO|nr:hypothetical protein B0H17DRAFT_1128742 [Mycena rosella]